MIAICLQILLTDVHLLCCCPHMRTAELCSDVTKLVKIDIRGMRILTFKIRRMRMQIEAFYHSECNAPV